MKNRISKILTHTAFQRYLTEIEIWEKERKYCGHDWNHLISVSRISYILLLERGQTLLEIDNGIVLREIVYGAGLLHDIGRVEQYKTNRDHALVGADLAVPILLDAGYSDKEVELMVKAIKEHRNSVAGATSLGKILYLADNLARQCNSCQVKSECYKAKKMPTIEVDLLY